MTPRLIVPFVAMASVANRSGSGADKDYTEGPVVQRAGNGFAYDRPDENSVTRSARRVTDPRSRQLEPPPNPM